MTIVDAVWPSVPPDLAPLFPPDLGGPMRVIALDVAARLREPGRVEEAVSASVRDAGPGPSVPWRPYAIARGDAGLAVFFGALDRGFPGEGWDAVAHRHLERATRGAEQTPHLPHGLFGGLCGVAFAAWSLSRGGTRYRKLLSAVEDQLFTRAAGTADVLCGPGSDNPTLRYDLISGATGLGTYLLSRRDEPRALDALRAILAALAGWSDPDEGRPCWFTPSTDEGNRAPTDVLPPDSLRCGLAHGLAGPLALLALAQLSGVDVDGLGPALSGMAGWVLRHRVDDAWGMNWPMAVAPGPASSDLFTSRPSHAGWCYGSPGDARALWLAGKALGRADLCDAAVSAMEAVARRPPAALLVESPTFCHGYAGLLQITLRFARETGLPALAEAAREYARHLVAFHEPGSRLGFLNLESGGRLADQPGLLDGAAGVALVLLAAASGNETDWAWDRLFLLS